jgi:hypothetical protein
MKCDTRIDEISAHQDREGNALCDVSQSGDGEARRITGWANLSWFRFVAGGAALRSARPGR